MGELGNKLIEYLNIENQQEKIKLATKAMLIEILSINQYCDKEKAEKLVLTKEEKSSYDYRILDLAVYWGSDFEEIFANESGILKIFDKIFNFIDDEFVGKEF